MKNKFLDQYPQLRDPKVGDKILITQSKFSDLYNEFLYEKGDTGTIVSIGIDIYIKIDNSNRWDMNIPKYRFKLIGSNDFKFI